MDVVKFEQTRRILDLTEELPEEARQMAYVFLQGMVAAQRIMREKEKNENKKEGKENDA